ncbi:MAG TPA: sigma 54-interacting transcriptional regulator [Polyangia bacterium]|nr:sigma 54-interacting transcriptional regulator [Polyangia bacterium]
MAAAAARATSAGPSTALVWLFPMAVGAPLRLQGEGPELTIGRDEACDVHLTGNDVSRRHAVLRRGPEATGATIADLGSRNGVRVNGRLVAEAPIGPGDVIRLGGWVGIVTESPAPFEEIAPGLWGGGALQAALAPLRQAAVSDLPIVLEGETGCGKEVVSRALHRWSGRSGPLCAVNCAALPEGLAEGELFGYRRGAFTGADRASPGYFRGADGGTLLLDEVSDLPLALQAKLLRVLEERAVQPLGETQPVPIDVRVVVAGQQPLMEVMRAGRFRADLLARLDGLTVRLPPLRARREDVLPMFARLLAAHGKGQPPAVDVELAERLCLHDWPFNVRELVLLAKRLLTLYGSEGTLHAGHLPKRIVESGLDPAAPGAAGKPADSTPPTSSASPRPISEPVELPALVVALRASGGNVARAASILGISRQRAYRLMDGQSVDLEALRGEPEKAP